MYNEKDDFLHHEKEIDDFLWRLSGAEVGIDSAMTVLDHGPGQGCTLDFCASTFARFTAPT